MSDSMTEIMLEEREARAKREEVMNERLPGGKQVFDAAFYCGGASARLSPISTPSDVRALITHLNTYMELIINEQLTLRNTSPSDRPHGSQNHDRGGVPWRAGNDEGRTFRRFGRE